MSQRHALLFLLPATCLLTLPALAQSSGESLALDPTAVRNKHRDFLDSVASLAHIDRLRDSLTLAAWSDTLRHRINRRFSPDMLTLAADSMRNINLPEPAIVRHSDSLLQQKMALLKEVDEKQNTLQRKVFGRYANWTNDLRQRLNPDSAGVRLPVTNLPTQPSTLPTTGLPAFQGPNFSAIPPIPGLDTEDFSSLGISTELTTVGGPMTIPSTPQLGEWQKSLPSMPDAMGEMSKQVNGLKELSANPSDAVEKALVNTAEVSEATKALNQAEELNKNEALQAAEQLKDPNATKEALKEQAVNHFAGKEAELQGAMSQMAKYKKKYSSIGSLSEIPKNQWLPRNGLKGKPFRERFRPGMNVGLRSHPDTLLLDVFPNAAYRITGRLEAGLGGIYRLRLSTSPFGFDQRDPVWGLAAFGVVKTFKSVFLRFETNITSHVRRGGAEQAAYRDWRWSFHSGIQTNFKISKRWTGSVQMLYNFESNLKDGFPERLTGRAGVQYKLK